MHGRAVLFEFHGDPSLRERMFDLPFGVGLPDGWVVLLPPEQSSAEAGTQ